MAHVYRYQRYGAGGWSRSKRCTKTADNRLETAVSASDQRLQTSTHEHSEQGPFADECLSQLGNVWISRTAADHTLDVDGEDDFTIRKTTLRNISVTKHDNQFDHYNVTNVRLSLNAKYYPYHNLNLKLLTMVLRSCTVVVKSFSTFVL